MYPLIGEINDVGLLAPPFDLDGAVPGDNDRTWIGRGNWLDRGPGLNRYTGETVYLTQAVGFGDGEFGSAVFGWS